MGGITNRAKLPYPSGTDKVRSGAANIQSLAEALDPLVFRDYRSHVDTSTVSVSSAVFTKAATPTLDEAAPNTQMSGGTVGIYVPAGLYQIDVMARWSVNATGQRVIGAGDNAASGPTGYPTQESAVAGTAGVTQHGHFQTRFAATTQVVLFAYQDSGAVVTIAARKLMIRWIGP